VIHPEDKKGTDTSAHEDSLEGYIRSLLQERARRYASPFVVSAVGGGGKTTTLVRLFMENFKPRSVLTTTTAMFAPDFRGDAMNPYLPFQPLDAALLEITARPPDKSCVWFGAPFGDIPGKYHGITPQELDAFVRGRRDREDRSWILLCEADGSKRKPLKAHAAHEPVIPRTTDLTLIVFGLSGVGKPLSEQYIHRSEHFAEAVGKREGDIISFDDLIGLLRNEHFLKGIPPTSRVVVVFNQMDSLPSPMRDTSAVLHRMDEVLQVPRIDAVFFTGGAGTAHGTAAGKVRNRTGSPLFSAIILAAGLSTRMGTENKLLLPLDGKTVIGHTVSRVLASDIRELIVVVGHEAAKVRQAVLAETCKNKRPDTEVKIVFNDSYENGQGTSVSCGTRRLDGDSAACFYIPGDQPFISPAVMRALAESSEPGKIVVPVVNGRRTSPALFDRSLYPELACLSGDRGGRQVIDSHESDAVAEIICHDELSGFDLDTRESYEAAIIKRAEMRRSE